MGKIIITGATGNLGGLVVQHLIDKGIAAEQIVAVARDSQKAVGLAALGVEVRIGDYDDAASLLTAFADGDKLLFVSASSMDNTLRVRQHATVVEAARNAGVGQIVYTSFAFAAQMTIGLENVHLATEYMIRTTGIPFTFLRNGFYLELLVNESIHGAIAAGEITTAAGQGLMNYVARDDLALATANVLIGKGHENKSYELVSPNPISYDDLAAILTELSGKDVHHKVVLPDEAIQGMIQSGAPEGMAGFMVHVIQKAIAEGQFGFASEDLVHLLDKPYTTVKAAVAQVIK